MFCEFLISEDMWRIYIKFQFSEGYCAACRLSGKNGGQNYIVSAEFYNSCATLNNPCECNNTNLSPSLDE